MIDMLKDNLDGFTLAKFLLMQAGIKPHVECEGGCDAGCQYGITRFELDIFGIDIDNNGITHKLKIGILDG